MDKQFMTRRSFLYTAAVTTAGTLAGCAVNPVTGSQQLMLVSTQQEIDLDKKNAPHQFSADYGKSDDARLQKYISEVGLDMARRTHRKDMPYNFQVVNAAYVNAYAFPGGSIAATRGIMLTMNNEAELGALLGHELGHVNARHTASRVSKGMAIQLMATGLSLGVSQTDYSELTPLVGGLGNVGAGALLAFYSREDERQADALGMDYMVQSGYSPQGMVGLQQHLIDLHKSTPNALELLFASHPMSQERHDTAVERANSTYAHAKKLPLYRERYMDNTASLRAIKGAIEAMQDGAKFMGKKQYSEAEKHFAKAIKIAPDDYAARMMMSKCQLALGNNAEADRQAELARQTKPGEPQADNMSGLIALRMGNYSRAEQYLSRYDRKLPGNPQTSFLRGQALEAMGRRDQAARQYYKFLKIQNSGPQAQHAYTRLQDWGYGK